MEVPCEEQKESPDGCLVWEWEYIGLWRAEQRCSKIWLCRRLWARVCLLWCICWNKQLFIWDLCAQRVTLCVPGRLYPRRATLISLWQLLINIGLSLFFSLARRDVCISCLNSKCKGLHVTKTKCVYFYRSTCMYTLILLKIIKSRFLED